MADETENNAQEDKAAEANADAPASAGTALAAVVLLGLGLLSLAGERPRANSGSHLRGSLLRDLRQWRARPL